MLTQAGRPRFGRGVVISGCVGMGWIRKATVYGGLLGCGGGVWRCRCSVMAGRQLFLKDSGVVSIPVEVIGPPARWHRLLYLGESCSAS